ncbi:hypothetical protein [Nocardia sp. NPDC050435]|uniref:hypothetical protein n=1 Tax=Nocardia sp. NPDC050435 TaxID=3155040 RepID=UPI00340DA634
MTLSLAPALHEKLDAPTILAAMAAIISHPARQRAFEHQDNLERARARAELAARSARGPQLLLSCAATSEQAAICRPDGRVVWRRRFADLPDVRVVTTLDAIDAVARHAIWIAGRARLEWGAEAATLRLVMDRRRRALHERLHRHAYGLGLSLEILADPAGNPAMAACADTTAVDWHPNLGLTDLQLARRIPT